MKIRELRESQAIFEGQAKGLKQKHKKLEKLRKKFVADFAVEKLVGLSLDEYVSGKGKKTFCYRIENELNQWGNIHGSTARKFGIYFGTLGEDKEQRYRIGKAIFGKEPKEAFEKIKLSIIELIENPENFDLIKKNPISPMLKGKILSLYYPDKFLNTFSSGHLDYFINCLSINNTSKSEIEKQSLLLNYKNNDLIMREWSNFKFNEFLYATFGDPKNSIKDKALNKELRKYKQKDFPPIEKLKVEFISLITESCSPKQDDKRKAKSVKVDYSSRSQNYKRIGDRGEQIVILAEKNYLTQSDRSDLANKIDHVAIRDDSVGYDILSYNPDGSEKQIEVKATTQKVGVNTVFITANELAVAKKSTNYYFYIVYDVGSEKPEIWPVKASDFFDDKNIELIPESYRIQVSTNRSDPKNK